MVTSLKSHPGDCYDNRGSPELDQRTDPPVLLLRQPLESTTAHGLLSLIFFNLIFCPILFTSLSLTSSPPFLVFSSPSAKLTTAVPTALTPGSRSVLTVVPRPGCEGLSPPLATVPCLGAVGEIPVVNTSPGEGRSMELGGTCLNFWPGCQQAAYLCAAVPAEAAFSRDRAPSERCRGAALEALLLSSVTWRRGVQSPFPHEAEKQQCPGASESLWKLCDWVGLGVGTHTSEPETRGHRLWALPSPIPQAAFQALWTKREKLLGASLPVLQPSTLPEFPSSQHYVVLASKPGLCPLHGWGLGTPPSLCVERKGATRAETEFSSIGPCEPESRRSWEWVSLVLPRVEGLWEVRLQATSPPPLSPGPAFCSLKANTCQCCGYVCAYLELCVFSWGSLCIWDADAHRTCVCMHVEYARVTASMFRSRVCGSLGPHPWPEHFILWKRGAGHIWVMLAALFLPLSSPSSLTLPNIWESLEISFVVLISPPRLLY